MPHRRVLQYCCAALTLIGLFAAGHAAAKPPSLVPPGWSKQSTEDRRDVIRYVSPDGQAVLTLRDIARHGASVKDRFAEMSKTAAGRITYRRLARSWFVLSGYRDGKIFYLRVDRACDGRRWHIAELTYPRAQKSRLDPAVAHASRTLGAYRNVCTDNG